MCHHRDVALSTNEILARPADTTSVPPDRTFRESHRADSWSHREQQAVALIRDAKSNKQIACELHLGEGTVKEYLYRILLHVSSRTEPALRLYCEGLLGGIT